MISNTLVLAIEGADNVGKTSLINFIKRKYSNNYILNNKRVEFAKFPSSNVTNAIETLFKEINSLEPNEDNMILRDNKISILMEEMILDQKSLLINNPDIDIIISDRGMLSTYLYQYRNFTHITNKESLSIDKERLYLYNFFVHNVPLFSLHKNDIETEYVNIILNNNLNKNLSTNTIEDDEYKNRFDSDTFLQRKINNSISNIVKIQEEGFEEIREKFLIYNIFDPNDNHRYSTEELYNNIEKDLITHNYI